MSIDFFETECKEPERSDSLFGICDDQDGNRAYTNTENIDSWIVKVVNKNKRLISFTAIDNCIIIFKDGTKDKESSCDGMITFTDSLFLIELKNQGTGGWITTAIDQLENTIKLLLKKHNLDTIKYKKAFACNKKHPRFSVIDNERNKRFFKNYGFRIDVQATIEIK